MKTTDNIVIVSSSFLSSDYYDSLMLLYQPIIKNAVSLYMTLFSLLEKDKRSNKIKLGFLVDILNCNIKDFIENKDKLEGMGLLNTYQKDDEYLLGLKLPLSVKEFFVDGFFGALLENTIGIDNVIKIKKKFSISEINKKEYKETTKSFDEVFKVDLSELENGSTNNFYPNDKKNKGIKVKNQLFDLDFVLKDFKDNLPDNEYLLKELKDNIIKYAFLYNIKEAEMITILNEIKDVSKTLDNKVFLNSVKTKYIEKQQEEEKKKDYSGLISNLEKANINNIFFISVKRMPILSEVEVVNRLVNEYGLVNSYVNYMLLFILKKKDNLPNYNYLKKMIEDWRNKGLYNTEDLILYLTGESEKLNQTKTFNKNNRKKTKVVEDPDWLLEAVKTLK